MKRSELEIGLEVALRRPRQNRERAIIVDLETGWQSGKHQPRRPWTAYHGPNLEDFGWVRSGVLWGPRFELSAARSNSNVAVARELRRGISTYETEHVGWVPDVVPLAQVEQTWERWQGTVAEAAVRDAERNAALHERRDTRKKLWDADIRPVLYRACHPVSHSIVDRLGMDYVELSSTSSVLHQVPAVLIELLAQRITELEKALAEVDLLGSPRGRR